MLILSSGEGVREFIPDDPKIRLVEISGNPEIGVVRNFGCELANGSVVAHWDDDDISAAGRLADQVERLVSNPSAAVTGYYSMRFTDGDRWWQYTGKPSSCLGTSLCYWMDWWRNHPFDSIQIGEDVRFAEIANRSGKLVTAPAGELMYATVHAGNTSPRQLSGSAWQLL